MKNSKLVKRAVYTICFFLFCIIEQRTKTCNPWDGWSVAFRDLTGVVMAVIILLQYRLSEFKRWKIPYLVWTVICVIGLPIAFVWGRSNRSLLQEWVIILLNVVLFGYILIHTFISVIWEKKYSELNKKFLAVWLIMMVLMVVSRSTYVWPLCYLIMFGCYYLTDCRQEDQEDLLQGMLNGIILGFFALQGFCFAFRPYDIVRYAGIFCNPNWNALFYVEVLAAVLGKILCVTKHNANKWLKAYYWLGAGGVLSFELLTIGRAGFLTAVVLIIAFLRFMRKQQQQKRWWRNLVTLSLCVILTFPLCFGAARYLPTLLHHPVLFWDDSPQNRVNSEDPWDSEKYVEIDEYMEKALGRFLGSFTNLLEHSPVLMKVNAAEELPSNKIPVLTPEQGKDGFLVRSTIYKYYFRHLNLWGYPYEEQGFQLREDYWIGHAHNIYLQYGTDFGIPVMILFAALILWGAVIMWKKYRKDGAVEDAVSWMYLLIPAIFGMFEYSWGVGSLSITMLFIAWRKAVCSGE